VGKKVGPVPYTGWKKEGFGGWVASARVDVGLTQAQLAAVIGISRASVANIEAGSQYHKHGPSVGVILRLARALGLDPLELCVVAMAEVNGACKPDLRKLLRFRRLARKRADLRKQLAAVTKEISR